MGEQISRDADSAPAWRAWYPADLVPLAIAALLLGAAYLPAGRTLGGLYGAALGVAGAGILCATILAVVTIRGFGLPHPRLALGIILVFVALGALAVAFGSLPVFALLACIGVFTVFVAEMFLGDLRRDLLRQLSGSYVVLSLALAALLWPFAYAISGGRAGVMPAAGALVAAGLARLAAGAGLAEHQGAALTLWALAGFGGGIGGALIGGGPWWAGAFGVLVAPVYGIADTLFVAPTAARANAGIQLMPVALGGALACALAALVA